MPFFISLSQYEDVGLLIVRLALGIIFIYHALPKLKNPKAMAQMMGISNMAAMPFVLGLVELLAGVALILGVYAQLAALLIAIIMVGAIFMKINAWKVPFAAQDKTGWEFDLVLLAAALLILFSGSGTLAVL